MEVSSNRGTSKLSILIGVSILNHPSGGTPILGNHHIVYTCMRRFAKVPCSGDGTMRKADANLKHFLRVSSLATQSAQVCWMSRRHAIYLTSGRHVQALHHFCFLFWFLSDSGGNGGDVIQFDVKIYPLDPSGILNSHWTNRYLYSQGSH